MTRTRETILMIEAKVARLEEAVNALHREVDAIREDIAWRKQNGGAAEAAEAAEAEPEKPKRARKKSGAET